MPSLVPVFKDGPLTFEVASTVKGGDFVAKDGSSTDKVVVATAGASKPLGVALYDGEPSGTSGSGTTSYGYTVHDFAVPRPHISVAHDGVYRLVAESAVDLGGAVEVSSTGSGVAASGGTNAIVGYCVQEGGIAAGESGKIRLSL